MPMEAAPGGAIPDEPGDAPTDVPAAATSTGEAPAPPAADAASSEPEAPARGGAIILGTGEIQQFAGELATQLFQRWETALHQQFQEELALRLQSELEHREHEARQLREEVEDRRVMWDGVWTKRHPRGMTSDYATWEIRQQLKRQSAQLAETRRQMRELRERLRELGHELDEEMVTVEAENDVPEDAGPAMDWPDTPGDGWVGGKPTGGH